MGKYTVFLNAVACASYVVEADNLSDAVDQAWKKASLGDCEAADWMHDDMEVELPSGEFASKSDLDKIEV